VRRAFLWLLVLALVPLLLLGIGRSAAQMAQTRNAVEAGLSARASETARWQAEVVRTARVALVLLSEHPDVRSGGVLCDIALGRVEKGFPAFSNVSRIRGDGVVACSSAQPLPKISVADRPWWPAAHKPNNFIITGPRWGTISHRQVLLAVLPVMSDTGTFDGVVTASIDMGWMERSLRSRALGADAVALIVDGKGNTLIGNKQAHFRPLDVSIGSGNVGNTTDADGRRWTYAVAPLVTGYDGSQSLFVAYAMPEAQLFSASWFQAGFSLLQPLVAVFIVSLVIWFGTNGLVLRWLRELRVLAKAFSEGDYRARLADFDTAPSEFRVLAAALYKMGQAVERRDSELRTALDKQNLLVREIHHRVKNNLQIVMSLLSLQADRLETEAGRAALSQTRLRISTLALVHRLLYETGEQATISSTKLLGGVCELLNQTLGKRSDITVHCDFDDSEIELDTAIPLCLWLVEATSNAWAHAFPNRPGTITTTLRFINGEGVLDVVDDGVGMTTDNRASSASARGLRILTGIAKQLGGTSAISSAPGSGTRLQLRYPTQPAQRAAA
jgi:two-component sensor histidine kinase